MFRRVTRLPNPIRLPNRARLDRPLRRWSTVRNAVRDRRRARKIDHRQRSADIGQGLRIISRGILQIDGEIEGDVQAAEVIVGEQGRCQGWSPVNRWW